MIEGSLFDTYLKLSYAAVKKSLESLREKPDRNRYKNHYTLSYDRSMVLDFSVGTYIIMFLISILILDGWLPQQL